MGLPVRVIVRSEMWERDLAWVRLKASFRLDRTAVGKEAILALF